MVTSLLLAWLGAALAAPPPPAVQSPRWEPVRAEPGDRDGERRLVRVWGDETLRAQCGARVVPHRRAVLDGALIDGPFSVPVKDGGAWVFPPAPRAMGTWLVTPASCDLHRLRAPITGASAAHLELDRPLAHVIADVVATDALTETERIWLREADAPEAAWATLRPPGPHAPGWTFWHADTTDATFTIRGPRRLVVSARWQGAPQDLCLEVDDVRACQARAVDERTQFLGGKLVRLPTDNPPQGGLALWRVLLPTGQHTVRVAGTAKVKITGTWPVLYTEDVHEVSPAAVHVAPSAEDAERAVQAPDGAPQNLLLFGPVDAPTRAEDVRWIALDNPSRALAERVDAPGVMTLHLVPRSEGPCAVRFADDRGWRARPEDAVQRFMWTGDAEGGGWPEVEGCDARIRVTGLSGATDAWAASRWWWVEPGGALTWEAPAPDARVWIRHPEERDVPYRLRVRHPSGRVDHWTIAPRAVPPDRWTARGGPWQPSVSVPLEAGDGTVEVWAEAPVVARLTALAPPEPAGASGSDPEAGASEVEPTLAAASPARADLAALSRAVAAAPTEAARAEALLARAGALEALGADRLAWVDWERAASLRPDAAEDNPITDRLHRATAALLHGAGRWVPADPIWVPVDAPPGAEGAAIRGDWIGVATRVRQAGGDPRPWWRQAVVGGQVLTAPQRMVAFRDLVVHTEPAHVEHPWLWPLRLTSGWERVHMVRGGVSRAVRWPDPEPDGPDLFPDVWAAEDLVQLQPGQEVQIPSAGGRALRVRCLGTRIELDAERCRFTVRDPQGRVLAETTTDTWGTPGEVAVPSGARTVYVGVTPSGGVVAQVQRPEGLIRERYRDAWSVWGGGVVSFDVLGPTVLRVEAWRPQGADAEVEVITRGGSAGGRVTRRVAGVHDILVPIDHDGPVAVQVRSSHQVWVIPSLRQPNATSRLAADDHRWIAAGLATSPPTSRAAPPEAPSSWAPPIGRPVQRPRLTGYLRTSVGTADADDLQPEPTIFPSLRGTQMVGLASRPTDLPLWIDARVRGDLSQSGALLGASGLVEWLAHRRTFNLWVLGSGEWIRGFTEAEPLASLHGRLRIQVDTWPWRRWQLIGRVQLDVRDLVEGEWDRYAYGSDLVRLWSRYKDEHRRGLTTSARARYRALPWLDASFSTWLGTNPHAQPLPEVWGTQAFVEGGRPGLWLRGGADLEHRFPDDLRRFGFWSPSVFARAAVTTWPDRDVALQIGASSRYRFTFDDFEAMLEFRLYISRDRGLSDLAPSMLADSHLPEWYHEVAAERRRAREVAP